MPKKEPTYTKAVIICHGKSEYILGRHIKSSLKISICNYAEQNGKSSIQIDGLNNVLNNTCFKSKNTFCNFFGVAKTKDGIKAKIFIIMDLDDTTEKQIESFKNKKMFKDHWAAENIIPIWNIPNFDSVMVNLGIIDRPPNDNEKTLLYNKSFPIKKDGKSDIEKIEKLRDMCKKNKNTNLDEMLEWMLNL